MSTRNDRLDLYPKMELRVALLPSREHDVLDVAFNLALSSKSDTTHRIADPKPIPKEKKDSTNFAKSMCQAPGKDVRMGGKAHNTACGL